MKLQETYGLMRSAHEIRVALEADGERIGEKLNSRRPQPAGEGSLEFDYRAQMGHLIQELDVSVDDVVMTEEEHSEHQIRLSRARRERNESVKSNHARLVATREGLESIYPDGAYELAFISGATPKVPLRLIEQLEQTVKLLRDPAVTLRETKSPAFNVDLELAASDLEAGVPELRSSLDKVDTVSKEALGAQLIRRKAIDTLHRTIIWVGRTAEGLFYLAEEEDLAKRIRSSTRRPKRPSEEAAEKAKEGEAQATESLDSEPSGEMASDETAPVALAVVS